LPLELERSYPKLCKLPKKHWVQKHEDRPSFDQIVKTMQGEVAEEVMRKEEPAITVYSVENGGDGHREDGQSAGPHGDAGEEGLGHQRA